MSVRAYAVIMAGGAGTRFWPASRQLRPKQLLRLIAEESLLRSAIQRVAPDVVDAQDVLIVTGEHLAESTRNEVEDLGSQVVVEPMPRNTAPCIVLAAVHVAAVDPESVMAVLPADHFIGNIPRFQEVCRQAIQSAATGKIVTLGIQPNRPETGYGYIRRGTSHEDGVYDVSAFVEKPNLETAVSYLEEGIYSWNSGMFFMRADVLLDAVRAHMPELSEGMDRYAAALGTPEEQAILHEVFEATESISIDYGIMERESERLAVIPTEFGWSDVGSWRTLIDFRNPGESNWIQGDVTTLDCRDSVIVSTGPHVATIGLEGLAVVATPDAVLVAPLDRSQDVGKIAKGLKADGRTELV